MSERTVRSYCVQGKIKGAQKVGKTWVIPIYTVPPRKGKPAYGTVSPLVKIIIDERDAEQNGIYRYSQINLCYNSSKLENKHISPEQVSELFRGRNQLYENTEFLLNDFPEALNHFRAFDYILNFHDKSISPDFILRLYEILSAGITNNYIINETTEENCANIGNYEQSESKDSGYDDQQLFSFLDEYNKKSKIELCDIVELHIHLYYTKSLNKYYKGRIGRLIMFHECLRNNICPFIIPTDSDSILEYYKGIESLRNEKDEEKRKKSLTSLTEFCEKCQREFVNTLKSLCSTTHTDYKKLQLLQTD